MVALHLEQKPYVQEFKEIDELRGSVPLPAEEVPLRNGRFHMNVKALYVSRGATTSLEANLMASSLLIPIGLCAKVVKQQNKVPALGGKPFNRDAMLEKGIHLHWALPDALARAKLITEADRPGPGKKIEHFFLACQTSGSSYA